MLLLKLLVLPLLVNCGLMARSAIEGVIFVYVWLSCSWVMGGWLRSGDTIVLAMLPMFIVRKPDVAAILLV